MPRPRRRTMPARLKSSKAKRRSLLARARAEADEHSALGASRGGVPARSSIARPRTSRGRGEVDPVELLQETAEDRAAGVACASRARRILLVEDERLMPWPLRLGKKGDRSGARSWYGRARTGSREEMALLGKGAPGPRRTA